MDSRAKTKLFIGNYVKGKLFGGMGCRPISNCRGLQDLFLHKCKKTWVAIKGNSFPKLKKYFLSLNFNTKHKFDVNLIKIGYLDAFGYGNVDIL